MKSDLRLLRYVRPVFRGPAKERLNRAIQNLKGMCLPFRYTPDSKYAFPGSTPEATNELLRGMSGMVFWPSEEELDELDSAVTGLAALERARTITPQWKAYTLVNKRHTSCRLIYHLDRLIGRAFSLLQKEQESNQDELAELCAQARTGSERSSLVKRFLADLQKIKAGDKEVGAIEWEKYDRLLFAPNKPKRLVIGDVLAAELRALCYAHALEIIIEESRRTYEVRSKAEPLIEWVASLGNPKYASLVKLDGLGEFYARRAKEAEESVIEEKRKRIREGWRKRTERKRAKSQMNRSR